MKNKFIIELCGTPGFGKSPIINCLLNKSKHCKQWYRVEANHFEISFSKGYDNFELKAVWSILDTYSEAIKVIFDNQPSEASILNVFIFERGIFDRIAWARLLPFENPGYLEIAKDLERWLTNQCLLMNLDLIFIGLTSYDKAKIRKRKGGKLRVINFNTIQKLNQIYYDLYFEYKDELNIVLLDDLSRDVSFKSKCSTVSAHIDKFLATE